MKTNENKQHIKDRLPPSPARYFYVEVGFVKVSFGDIFILLTVTGKIQMYSFHKKIEFPAIYEWLFAQID